MSSTGRRGVRSGKSTFSQLIVDSRAEIHGTADARSEEATEAYHRGRSIHGLALDWKLVSGPQFSNSGDRYKGLCISVRVRGDARRELIIECPYPINKAGRPLPVPQRPPVAPKKVEAAILEAVSAGWDPGSRGKAFVFNAETVG